MDVESFVSTLMKILREQQIQDLYAILKAILLLILYAFKAKLLRQLSIIRRRMYINIFLSLPIQHLEFIMSQILNMEEEQLIGKILLAQG